MLAIMVVRRHHTSLTALSTDLAIEIVSHLVVTSLRPMDDLRSLRATCSSMHHIYGNPVVGQCLSLVRFRYGTMWYDPIDYEALFASLTQLGNLEACFKYSVFCSF
jgi:hypothetical protein